MCMSKDDIFYLSIKDGNGNKIIEELGIDYIDLLGILKVIDSEDLYKKYLGNLYNESCIE